MGPGGPKLWPIMAQETIGKMVPGGPIRAQKGPKRTQLGPKWSQKEIYCGLRVGRLRVLSLTTPIPNLLQMVEAIKRLQAEAQHIETD